MATRLEKGQAAKYKYNDVRYSHIEIGPGSPSVLTADPWSFLHGHLLQKSEATIGENRTRYHRENYFARLAEDFYRAAEHAELPTKGTLLYYGMLNLVKSFLSTRGVKLEEKHEYHGMNLPINKKFEVEIKKPPTNAVSIFAEFAKQLGTPVKVKHVIQLRDAFNQIPELHGICHDLSFIRRKKFLPIKIDFLVNESKEYLFTEVYFEKKHEQALLASRFLKGDRGKYFKEGYPRDGFIVYRSKNRKKVNNNNWDRVYKNSLKEYKKFKLTSILTRSGFRYYCDLDPGDYHHLCYSIMIMFYIGTAARYRPTEVSEVMSGELRPLITETSAICPKQFLYQLVSLTTDKLCVIPFAAF